MLNVVSKQFLKLEKKPLNIAAEFLSFFVNKECLPSEDKIQNKNRYNLKFQIQEAETIGENVDIFDYIKIKLCYQKITQRESKDIWKNIHALHKTDKGLHLVYVKQK